VFLFTFSFIFIFFKNSKNIDAGKFGSGFLNRESFMLVGMSTFILLAFIVLIGTASPIYTGLIGNPSSVTAGFYNATSIPISVVMLIAIALAPLLAWKVSELRDKNLIIKGLIISFFATVLAWILGLKQVTSILLFFLAINVIIINAHVSYRIFRKNLPKAGGYIAHVGLGFIVIGILTSSIYDKNEKVLLPNGDFQKTKLGYEVKFAGFVDKPNGKDEVKLIVKTDYGTYEDYPQFYYSEFSRSYMATPDVKTQLMKDIYISPVSFTPANMSNSDILELKKGETKTYNDLEITFNNFIVNMASGSPEVTADLYVALTQGTYKTEYAVKPMMKSQDGKLTGELSNIGDTKYKVSIDKVSANEGKVWLNIFHAHSDAGKDIMAIELSEKPLIGILWMGTILLAFGALLTLISHVRQKK
jgi:cytochrome c-type biogenesis protein CcmF